MGKFIGGLIVAIIAAAIWSKFLASGTTIGSFFARAGLALAAWFVLRIVAYILNGLLGRQGAQKVVMDVTEVLNFNENGVEDRLWH